MNKLETFGFVISILISLYLVREVRKLKNASLKVSHCFCSQAEIPTLVHNFFIRIHFVS